MGTLASDSTVPTLAAYKQHLLFSHLYFLHPEHNEAVTKNTPKYICGDKS